MRLFKLLLFIAFTFNYLPSISQNVLNNNFDTRFKNTYKSEEQYIKTIQKFELKIYKDYYTVLKKMDKSALKEEFIKNQLKHNLKNIKTFREQLNRKIEFNDKYNLHYHLNVLFDRFELLYTEELKEEIEIYFVKNLDLWDIKKRYSYLVSRRVKAQKAREVFNTQFTKYQKEEQLYKDPTSKTERFTKTENDLLDLEDKITMFENAYIYAFDLSKRMIKLITLDKEFKHYANGFDVVNMKKRQKFLLHHAKKEFNEISKLNKFNNTDNELRSNALRLSKYFINVAQKSQFGIIQYVEGNKKQLVQEYKNNEEYKSCSKDYSIFKNKQEHKAYIENKPSNKMLLKYDGLIQKYTDKLNKNIYTFDSSLQTMIVKYITKYKPTL